MSKDNINPDHYKKGIVECIVALEAATVGKFGIEAVCTTSAIKYLWRYEAKNGLEDVKKAQWYINMLIEVLERRENKSYGERQYPLTPEESFKVVSDQFQKEEESSKSLEGQIFIGGYYVGNIDEKIYRVLDVRGGIVLYEEKNTKYYKSLESTVEEFKLHWTLWKQEGS